MRSIGLPVPPGLTITTEACKEYYKLGQKFPDGMEEDMWAKLKEVEKETGRKFGDADNPLLVSVRSGAPVSMPGMMDTILNLGLNEQTVQGMIKQTSNERFVLDCFRRFIQMFANVVMEVEHKNFEAALEKVKEEYGVEVDKDLSPEALRKVIQAYKEIVKKETGREFPTDPKEQLIMAVKAVFSSWYNPRAIVYRKINKISDDLGTAVNVQSMVFGNVGDDSGTGVAFTRNPSTGEKKIYGEYLMNAQGKTLWPEFVHLIPFRLCRRMHRKYMHSLRRFVRPWKTTTGICRISSLPLNAVNYTCCRPEPERERPMQRSRLPLIYRKKD